MSLGDMVPILPAERAGSKEMSHDRLIRRLSEGGMAGSTAIGTARGKLGERPSSWLESTG
jgi:hypothetical protein